MLPRRSFQRARRNLRFSNLDHTLRLSDDKGERWSCNVRREIRNLLTRSQFSKSNHFPLSWTEGSVVEGSAVFAKSRFVTLSMAPTVENNRPPLHPDSERSVVGGSQCLAEERS